MGPGCALAFVINMLATNRLVVVVFVKESTLVQHLATHPVMKIVEKQKERVDAVFHLAGTQAVQSTVYR